MNISCWIKPVITSDIVAYNVFINRITLDIVLKMLDPMHFMLLAGFFI